MTPIGQHCYWLVLASSGCSSCQKPLVHIFVFLTLLLASLDTAPHPHSGRTPTWLPLHLLTSCSSCTDVLPSSQRPHEYYPFESGPRLTLRTKQSTSGFEEFKTFDHLSVGVQAFLPATFSNCWLLQATTLNFKDIKQLSFEHLEETQFEISYFIVDINIWYLGLGRMREPNPELCTCEAHLVQPRHTPNLGTFFILKLFQVHLAQNVLNVYSSCSTVGGFHQSVVEKNLSWVCGLRNHFIRWKSWLTLYTSASLPTPDEPISAAL